MKPGYHVDDRSYRIADEDDPDRCLDCGRASCTGEDCYWPEDAGLRHGADEPE
jgi:hypothetical protein